MTSDEGDDLLRHIAGFVHGRVPPNLENLVTELVGRTVVLVMTTPEFYNHLKMVQELQQENWNLRQALIAQSPQRHPSARKVAPRKAAPVKKAAKRAPVKKAAPSNVRAFKGGASGR